MSYVGNTPTQQAFTPAIDYFSGNGSTVAFTLSRPVASVAQVQAVIENVAQNPTSAFTVSGNTITFTSAPPSGTNNIYVYYTSPITQVAALPQNPQVFGNLQFSSAGSRITGDFSNATVANRVMFQTSTANGNTFIRAIPNGTATQSSFQVINSSDAANCSLLQILATAGDTQLSSGINGTGTYLPMTFYTGGSERMRIDTSGNVGIGTSSPTSKLEVAGQINGSPLYIKSGGSTSTLFYDTALLLTQAGTGERMRIDTSGNLLVGRTSNVSAGARIATTYNANAGNWGIGIQASVQENGTAIGFVNTSGTTVGTIAQGPSSTAYNTSSDYRLKHDIQPMTGALAKVAALKPVTYKWNADDSDGEGFIAHELSEVVPQCVTGEKDAVDADGNPVYQGIDTSFLVATLTAAIKEQQAIIASLTARIEALETK